MKIAIVRLSALGDIIQSAVVLQFIKSFKKDIEIHWFVDERFEGILKNHSLIDKLYALPLKDEKFIRSLKIALKARKNNYDAVIDLQGLIKSAIVSRILSRNNFGFDKDSLKESFAHNFYNQKLNISYNENVFVRYLSLASFVLNTDFNIKDLIFKKDFFEADEKIKEKLKQNLKLEQNKQNILIHVGSSEENKIFPKTKLAILCKLIIQDFSEAKIFLAWGNVKEYEFAKEVINLSAIDEKNIELAPKFSLEELVAFTKDVDLVIGNDSGPTHLAFAMNKPSITIFGATWDTRVCFPTQINKTISAGKKFDLNKKFRFDRNDFCITRIEEEDIFKLVKELLSEK